MKVNHEGWFSFCPIWMCEDGETIFAKYRMEWLLWLATEWQGIFIFLASFFNQEPAFRFRIRELPDCRQFEI